jgi:CHAD domain-containing protein
MNPTEDRVARSQTIALRALARLSRNDSRPKALHRLRIHLRRLQAYLELREEPDAAEALAQCVARLSRLRLLQVFTAYLDRIEAPDSDRRKVKDRIRTCRKKIRRKKIYRKIERRLRRLAPASSSPSSGLLERLGQLRLVHADHLRDLLDAAMVRPRRKVLHSVRLRIKAIRYQEEWALQQGLGRPELIKRLKHLQAVLGTYEEQAEFRRLAKALRLKSRPIIVKHWRQSRERARAVVGELPEILEALRGPLRLLKPSEPAGSRDVFMARHFSAP